MADVYTSEGALKPELNLDMSWIDKDVRSWCTTKGKQALESGSVALDVFRKRSSVSAFRVAALCCYLYLLDGNPEPLAQKRARRIYLFMSEYVLGMLTKRWSKRFEELQKKHTEEDVVVTNRPRLLDHLPQLFSRDQLRALMQQLDVTSPDRVLLSQWKTNKWIKVLSITQFEKLV